MKALIAIFGLLLCASAFARPIPQKHALGAVKKTKPIILILSKKNPTASVRLKSNPSTGYVWHVKKYNHALVSPIDSKYLAPKRMMPGAPGTEIFTFRLKPEAFKVATITKVRLQYARPSDPKAATYQTVVLVTHTNGFQTPSPSH